MREDDFDLIHQPWVRVRTADASLQEVSLLKLFEHAHEYQALSGELPTQDAAVLRVLLAILHTVFSRVDAEGEEAPLDEEDDDDAGLDRWEILWNLKQFPMEPIRDYLDSMQDRFWLFDEQYPFYQVPEAKRVGGTDAHGEAKDPYSVAKLNGEIGESGNKRSIFANRVGADKFRLSYSAAARWLIHLVGYDDCALKKSAEFKEQEKRTGIKSTESPGVSWLGKLGVVYAEGDNLFETLMLNLVMQADGTNICDTRQRPIWEETPKIREREKIAQPDNLAQLLTFPSRQICLERDNGFVVGYYSIFGMFFDPGIKMEQMTRRRGIQKKDTSPYAPYRHRQEEFLWQEFDSLFIPGEESGDQRPGIVHWIARLQTAGDALIEREKVIGFRAAGIFYDSKNSSIQQVETDCLSVHANVVSELGIEWRKLISGELAFSERVGGTVGGLAGEIMLAASGAEKGSDLLTHAREQGRSRFYDMMDLPFRTWLLSISATDSDMEGKRREWRDLVKKQARKLGRDMAENAGPAAYVGRTVKVDDKTEQFYSTAKAYAKFTRILNGLK